METRANYVIVGMFTIATILAAFGFVYWTSGIGDRGEVATLRFRIHGSASGLSRGSVVLFNGVKVGDIGRVYIDVSNPSVAIADAIVDRLTPVTRSTRAIVGLAGLTGQANIEMRGGNPSEPNLLDLAEADGTVAEITADPSAVSNLLESAQAIFRRADNVLEELETFTADARGPLTETVRNVEKFSQALGRNAEGIDTFLESVTAMSGTLSEVSDQFESTLQAAEELLRSVDREQVAAVVDNVERFTRRLDEASTGLDEIMANVGTASESIQRFSASANDTLARVDKVVETVSGVVEAVDPASVRTAMTNFEQASTTINAAANDVARLANTIGERSEDVDAIIADARQIAARLNQASERVDGVLARVDELLGSGEAEGLMADASETLKTFREVAENLNTRIDGVLRRVDGLLGDANTEQLLVDARETLKSFREVADTLNARVGTITDGLARFSGQGLRDVEALVRDGRRSIMRIEQAITDLERNPQRILSGGSGTVRQYDGRARR